MKKVLLVLALILIVLVVGAQELKQATLKKGTQITLIKVANLPKSITDNIATEFKGCTIKEAAHVVSDSTSWYEVVVAKKTAADTLVYDKNGKFVKSFGSYKVIRWTGPPD